MTNTFMQPPVIIVGGGLSGLSAAALLARAGQAVTVFEKAGSPGGRAVTKQHGEYFFNLGAHGFYVDGFGERLLHELGVSYTGQPPALHKFLAVEANEAHDWPIGATLESTKLLSASAKEELAGFYKSLKDVNLAELRGMSMLDWVEQQVQDPQVRQFLLGVARLKTYTNAPEMVDASYFVQLMNVRDRLLYLDGGWQTLVDGLRQAAEQAGAKIVTQARAVALESAEEGFVVRLANGSVHPAAAVLLATDPETASALVANGTHEELSRWAAQSIPARVACFDVALRRFPRPEHMLALGMDCPLYYSAHSIWAKLAPEGHVLIHTMKFLRPEESAGEASKRELQAWMDVLQPGWREEVVEEYFLPQMVVSNAIVQASRGGLSGRPGPAVPGMRNLYVAGDWVGADGKLAEACFASASQAARMIMTSLAAQRADVVVG